MVDDLTIYRPTWAELEDAACDAAGIATSFAAHPFDGVYGIPRGGCAPALLVAQWLGIPVVDRPELAHTLVVDDVVESGETRKRYLGYPFVALFGKSYAPSSIRVARLVPHDAWIEFPWEVNDAPAADALLRLWQVARIDTAQLGDQAAAQVERAAQLVAPLAGEPLDGSPRS